MLSSVAYQGAQVYLQCTWFISSPSLLLVFFGFSSQISLCLPLLNYHFLTPVSVRGYFVAGKGHSPLTLQVVEVLCSRTAISPLGVLKSGLYFANRVAFVVCILKMLVWEDPRFLTVHGEVCV